MTKTDDFIVVGAGINGLMTAYYLNKAGANVTVLDQSGVGSESSWAGGGILSPLYPWRYPESVTRLVSWSQQIYPSLCRQLSEETAIDPEWRQSGLLIQQVADEESAQKWCEHYQISHRWISDTEHKALFPEVSSCNGASIYFDEVAQVRNPRLVKALAKYLSSHQVRILCHEKLRSLSIKHNRIEGIITSNQTLNATAVCLANGAWMRQYIPADYTNVEIEPVKGQMILLQSTPDLINHIVLRDSRYVIPRQDGLTLVGSTLEKKGYDKSITEDAKQELLKIAGSIVPRLNNYKLVKHWAGLRPGSPDGIPNICQHPEVQGLFLNGGQYRNGVAMGPASGQLMANIMLREKTIVDAKSYQLAAAGNLSPVQKSY